MTLQHKLGTGTMTLREVRSKRGLAGAGRSLLLEPLDESLDEAEVRPETSPHPTLPGHSLAGCCCCLLSLSLATAAPAAAASPAGTSCGGVPSSRTV